MVDDLIGRERVIGPCAMPVRDESDIETETERAAACRVDANLCLRSHDNQAIDPLGGEVSHKRSLMEGIRRSLVDNALLAVGGNGRMNVPIRGLVLQQVPRRSRMADINDANTRAVRLFNHLLRM